MLCFLCMFILFSWRILPQTGFLRSPDSIPSVTLGHSHLTTQEIFAMCTAAKTVKTIFYVTKKKSNLYLQTSKIGSNSLEHYQRMGINCVGSGQLINLK